MVKKAVLAVLIVFTLLFFFNSKAYAFFDKIGASVSIGSSGQFTFGCKDPNYNFYWDNVGLFGRKNLNTKLYLDFEGDLGYLSWRGEHNSSAISLEGRMIFLIKVFRALHIGLGGGFSVLSERNGHPGLGTDGFYGLITGKVRFAFKTERHEYGFDLIADHISSPTEDGSKGDDGKNVMKGRFYFTF